MQAGNQHASPLQMRLTCLLHPVPRLLVAHSTVLLTSNLHLLIRWTARACPLRCCFACSACLRLLTQELFSPPPPPQMDEEGLLTLLRLLRLSQPLGKGQLQRLMHNLCANSETREVSW